jgi:hypothetical protein
MKTRSNPFLIPIICISGLAFLLVACGGGGGSSSTGTLNLGLTDASVDDAKAVVVEFTGVQLQSAGGDRIDHDFIDELTGDPAPRLIDLMALTGGTTELLLDGVTLNAGRYNWVRLKVNAERGVIDSYIDLLDDSRHSLTTVPVWNMLVQCMSSVGEMQLMTLMARTTRSPRRKSLMMVFMLTR